MKIKFSQILNALTCEVLDHQGTFRTPSDQIQFISQTLKDSKPIKLLCIPSMCGCTTCFTPMSSQAQICTCTCSSII